MSDQEKPLLAQNALLQQENAQLRQQLAEQQETLNDTQEELAMIARDWNDIVKALGLRHHGAAIGRAAEIRRRADACRCQPSLITTHNSTQPKG